jgi:hypothetical protein
MMCLMLVFEMRQFVPPIARNPSTIGPITHHRSCHSLLLLLLLRLLLLLLLLRLLLLLLRLRLLLLLPTPQPPRRCYAAALMALLSHAGF